MYCQHCGTETTAGLRYCKKCGANIALPQESVAPPKFPMALTLGFLLVIAIIAITGIVAPFSIFSETSIRGGSTKELMPLLFIAPLVAFGMVGLLTWLMLRLIKIYQHPGADEARRDANYEARQTTSPQLAAPPEMLSSVTEHTTRNFEPVENILQRRDPKEKMTR